jgi:hypothetical protein
MAMIKYCNSQVTLKDLKDKLDYVNETTRFNNIIDGCGLYLINITFNKQQVVKNPQRKYLDDIKF